MTPVQRQNPSPQNLPPSMPHSGEPALEVAWAAAYRALLLLTDAAHPADPTLARLADEDLARLRVALARLSDGEHTSAA